MTTRQIDSLRVEVLSDQDQVGRAAARFCADTVRTLIARQGHARLVFATGNSQLAFIRALPDEPDVDWSRVTVFHLDEYVGLSADHPASFRRWIRSNVVEALGVGTVHYLDATAADPEDECRRYTELLQAVPLDLVCCGIGENGHIAFNEPGSDFADPHWVNVVTLDERSRRQQVGEGHFASLAEVPERALSLSIPAVMSAAALQVVVPERRKAEAVRTTLTADVSPACPATILRTHPAARLFLDADAASLLAPNREP